MDPLVSVIIPCYNCAGTVARTIQSIVDQDYKYTEIIAVCSPSTDNTELEISRMGARYHNVRIVKEKEKTTCSNGRNLGYNNSKGKYVVFIDADDWMEPGRISEQVVVLESRLDFMWCSGGIRSVSMDGKETINNNDPSGTSEMLLGILSLMFRREILEKVAYPNVTEKFGFIQTHVFKPDMPYFDDVDLFLRVRKFAHAHLDEVVSNYLLNNCGLTRTTKVYKSDMTMWTLIVRHRAYDLIPFQLKETAAHAANWIFGRDMVKWKKENLK